MQKLSSFELAKIFDSMSEYAFQLSAGDFHTRVVVHTGLVHTV